MWGVLEAPGTLCRLCCQARPRAPVGHWVHERCSGQGRAGQGRAGGGILRLFPALSRCSAQTHKEAGCWRQAGAGRGGVLLRVLRTNADAEGRHHRGKLKWLEVECRGRPKAVGGTFPVSHRQKPSGREGLRDRA